MKNTSIILTYKGKILLFSKDMILNPEETLWDILRVGKNTKTKLIEFIKKEMNIGALSKKQDITLTPLTDSQDNFSVYYIKMTDENVNAISRKKGWRLEFYRINELDKISLSPEADLIFDKYKTQIKDVLAG